VLISIAFLLNSTNKLEQENLKLKIKVIRLNERADLYVKAYYNILSKDSVLNRRYDSLLSEKQKIKKEYVYKIKQVDRYSISDMQRYFDERTGKGSDTRQHAER
jgi:hypothetical protein